jgi:hypothetical protein
MIEPCGTQAPPPLHLLDMATDRIAVEFAPPISHYAALCRTGPSHVPTEDVPRHSEDGVWNDHDIPV